MLYERRNYVKTVKWNENKSSQFNGKFRLFRIESFGRILLFILYFNKNTFNFTIPCLYLYMLSTNNTLISRTSADYFLLN